MLKLFSELKQVYIEFKVSFRIQEFHSQFNFREKKQDSGKTFFALLLWTWARQACKCGPPCCSNMLCNSLSCRLKLQWA
jgi:hypothetical protein